MFNFKLVGHIDPEPWIGKLKMLPESTWYEYTDRQKKYRHHALTNSIPLVYDINIDSNEVKKHKHYDYFSTEINQIEDILKSYYGDGVLVRIILVSLFKRSKIPPHTDGGVSLIKCHRVHIPIITNKDVTFTVNNEKKIMNPGEMWEINNTLQHAAANNSYEDRIHIIADWDKNE